jgi:hypothetical protein
LILAFALDCLRPSREAIVSFSSLQAGRGKRVKEEAAADVRRPHGDQLFLDAAQLFHDSFAEDLSQLQNI